MSPLEVVIVVVVVVLLFGGTRLAKLLRRRRRWEFGLPQSGRGRRAQVTGIDARDVAEMLEQAAASLKKEDGSDIAAQVEIQLGNVVVNQRGETITVSGDRDELMKVLLDAGVPAAKARQVVSFAGLAGTTADTAGSAPGEPTTEQLLAELELLKSQGMIDEREYQQRREALLKKR